MSQFDNAIRYLKKLKNTINKHNEVKLFDYAVVKKSLIDDVICCFIGVLPAKLRKKIDIGIETEQSDLCSVGMYNQLIQSVKTDFIMDKNYYLLNAKQVGDIIDKLIPLLKTDIEYIEKITKNEPNF